MVYQDQTPSQTVVKPAYRIPPIADRLLSVVFDVVLFTPIFSLILANLFRKLELMYFTSPNSTEFLVLCVVAGVFVVILTVLFQTLFLMLLGATPGKYFFKIQVISLEGRLRFSQALLRSVLWVGEVVFLGMPFLEILSETSRRPLHDRAAGTVVVTLKKQGDPGPQVLETQFMRHFFVIFSLAAFVWVIFFVGHFYKQAVRGEFKKSELEADQYLCSSVSSSLQPKDQRIDKALALFMADEISEECLASEADFVLWTQNESDKSWAYLAKGLLQKSDSDQFEAYLEKACEEDEQGTACEIAQYEADPMGHAIPKEGATSSILKVTQDFEKGLYKQAEKEFLELARDTSFQTFAQQGLVKAYWAQNKVERAQGAYQNVVHQMSKTSRKELASWICHEELDKKCSTEAIEACEDLKAIVHSDPAPVQETFIAVALIREKECRQSPSLDYKKFHSLLEQKPDVFNYVRAISKEVELSRDEKSKILKDLAFRKESVRPLFLRRLALQEWVSYMQTDEDYHQVSQFLKDKKVRDLSWIKVYDRALQTFLKAKASKVVKEIIDLPSDELVSNYQMQAAQIQGHYLAQNYDKAWATLQKYQSSSRSPASVGWVWDLTKIRQELEKRQASHGASK
jgi:uncharacterized RDD family membrane protein YckC